MPVLTGRVCLTHVPADIHVSTSLSAAIVLFVYGEGPEVGRRLAGARFDLK